MAVLSLLHLGVLLIAIQVVLGIPWSVRPAARYEGYDLERGPVLYEAYYPEEQDVKTQSPKIYQEKRYFDLITVPERSYQIPTDPYELPYESEEEEEDEEDGIHEEYVRPDSVYPLAFTRAKPQTVTKNGYVTHELQGNRQYIFAEEPEIRQSNLDHLNSVTANDYSYPVSQSGSFENLNVEDPEFVEENRSNFGRDDVQRIVPINDEFVFGEQPLRMVPDFKGSFENSNQKIVSVTQDHNRATELRSLPMENIFEPRPQTIKYVFSVPKKAEEFKPVALDQETEDNDWPRNYGDNLLQGELVNEDEQELKNEEGDIASIKVSQVSHHKIRHHHGERPKRNNVRH